MSDIADTAPAAAPRSLDLLDEIRDSAKLGQHAAADALHRFRQTVDEAVPDALQPLRTKIVDAAIELAETLVTAQYRFNRSLIRSADRALTGPGAGEA